MSSADRWRLEEIGLWALCVDMITESIVQKIEIRVQGTCIIGQNV